MKYILTFIIILFLFSSCDENNTNYPFHSVYDGNAPLIIYKMEKITDNKYGDWKYAVTDGSKKGWTLVSFNKFNVGDTLYISNKK